MGFQEQLITLETFSQKVLFESEIIWSFCPRSMKGWWYRVVKITFGYRASFRHRHPRRQNRLFFYSGRQMAYRPYFAF